MTGPLDNSLELILLAGKFHAKPQHMALSDLLTSWVSDNSHCPSISIDQATPTTTFHVLPMGNSFPISNFRNNGPENSWSTKEA